MGNNISEEAVNVWEGERAIRRQQACDIGILLDEEQDRRVQAGVSHSVVVSAQHQDVLRQLLRSFNVASILPLVEAERARRVTRDRKFEVQEDLLRQMNRQMALRMMYAGMHDRLMAASDGSLSKSDALVEAQVRLVRRAAVEGALVAMAEEQQRRVAIDAFAAVLEELRSLQSRRLAGAAESAEQRRRLEAKDTVLVAAVRSRLSVQGELLRTGRSVLASRPVDVPRALAFRVQGVCRELAANREVREQAESTKRAALVEMTRRANRSRVVHQMRVEQAERVAFAVWQLTTQEVTRVIHQRSSDKQAGEEQLRRIVEANMHDVLQDVIRVHNRQAAVHAMEEERQARVAEAHMDHVLEQLRHELARRKVYALRRRSQAAREVAPCEVSKHRVRSLLAELEATVARRRSIRATEDERARRVARDTFGRVQEELLRVRCAQMARRLAAQGQAERLCRPPPLPPLAEMISEFQTALIRAVGVRGSVAGAEAERTRRVAAARMLAALEELTRSLARRQAAASADAERSDRIAHPPPHRLDVTLLRRRLHAELDQKRVLAARQQQQPPAAAAAAVDPESARLRARLHMELFHALSKRAAGSVQREALCRRQFQTVMRELAHQALVRDVIRQTVCEQQRRVAEHVFHEVLQAIPRRFNQAEARRSLKEEQEHRVARGAMRAVLGRLVARVHREQAQRACAAEQALRVRRDAFQRVAAEAARRSNQARAARESDAARLELVVKHQKRAVCETITGKPAPSAQRFRPVIADILNTRGITSLRRRRQQRCRRINVKPFAAPTVVVTPAAMAPPRKQQEQRRRAATAPAVEDEVVCAVVARQRVLRLLDGERERRVVRDLKWRAGQELVRRCNQRAALAAMEEEQVSRIFVRDFEAVLHEVERRFNQRAALLDQEEERERRIVANRMREVQEELVRAVNARAADRAMRAEHARRICAHRMKTVQQQLIRVVASIAQSDLGSSARKSIPTMAWSNRDDVRNEIKDAITHHTAERRRAELHAELVLRCSPEDTVAHGIAGRVVSASAALVAHADALDAVLAQLLRQHNVAHVTALARGEQQRRLAAAQLAEVLGQLQRRHTTRRLKRAAFVARRERMHLLRLRPASHAAAMAAVAADLAC